MGGTHGLVLEARGRGGNPGNGTNLRCEICKHTRFYRREGKVTTTAMTLFELEWANPSAECMVCESCGYVHWFLPV